MSYVEAVRQYPPGPEDKGCGLETLVSGWVHHRDGQLMEDTQLRGKLTYCDRVGATYMLPFGRIRPRKETYWVFQLSGWEAEWYQVVAVRRERSVTHSESSPVARAAAGSPESMFPSRAHAAAGLSALILITLVVPAVIPLANARHAARPLPPTYLPALEGPRERTPFEQSRIPDLRTLQPGYVVIGDSMAGTRLDERRLDELTGVQVAPLLQAGSGSAFWYLALKNWVIASGIRPRMVLIFFRDTNLTDVMFRLDQQFRWALDLAALDREDELNARRRAPPRSRCTASTTSSTASSGPSRRANGSSLR